MKNTKTMMIIKVDANSFDKVSLGNVKKPPVSSKSLTELRQVLQKAHVEYLFIGAYSMPATAMVTLCRFLFLF